MSNPKFRYAPTRRSAPPQIACHKMIRSVAIEMAAETYAAVMRGDNALYDNWKKLCPELVPELAEIKFIEMLWPKLIPQARATLARLLTTNLDEEQKECISDALIADATLRRATVGLTRH